LLHHWRAIRIICGDCYLVFVGLAMSGSVPWVSAGYEPHGSGKTIGPCCNTTYRAIMRFSLDEGARLDAEATFDKKSSPISYVFVSLTLRSHQTARFEGSMVSVETDSTDKPMLIAISDMQVDYTEEARASASGWLRMFMTIFGYRRLGSESQAVPAANLRLLPNFRNVSRW
jgi:hypothetical protein